MSLKTFFRILFQYQRKKKILQKQLLDDKYRIVPAFIFNKTQYFMFDNAFDVPTGRMFSAMTIYSEMEMRCDRSYLEAHVKAMNKLLSDPKKINFSAILQLNINLEERLALMPLPDYVYKLASVMFFDDYESPYTYDFNYNEKKIKEWKKEPETLDFFLSRLASTFVPSFKSAVKNLQTYSPVIEGIDKIHRQALTEILSGKQSTNSTKS